MTRYQPDEEHDYCITCGVVWEDTLLSRDVVLTECPQCGDLVCADCKSKKGQCGFCVAYNLPDSFKIIDYADIKINHSIHGGTLDDVPKPHKFYYDEHPKVVEISITKFYGIGHHHYVVLEEMPNSVWDSKENCWRECREARYQAWDKRRDFIRPSYISNWIRKVLTKRYGKEEEVWVHFDSLQGADRRWFYKEGD